MLFLTGPCQNLNIYFSHPLSFLFLLGLSVCPFVSLPHYLPICLSVNFLMETKNMLVFNSKYYFRRSAHYSKNECFFLGLFCLPVWMPACLSACLSFFYFFYFCMYVCLYVCMSVGLPSAI
jgi:hypothetical protein